MGYLNPIEAMGLKRLPPRHEREVGVDAVLTVDLAP